MTTVTYSFFAAQYDPDALVRQALRGGPVVVEGVEGPGSIASFASDPDAVPTPAVLVRTAQVLERAAAREQAILELQATAAAITVTAHPKEEA